MIAWDKFEGSCRHPFRPEWLNGQAGCSRVSITVVVRVERLNGFGNWKHIKHDDLNPAFRNLRHAITTAARFRTLAIGPSKLDGRGPTHRLMAWMRSLWSLRIGAITSLEPPSWTWDIWGCQRMYGKQFTSCRLLDVVILWSAISAGQASTIYEGFHDKC